MTQSTRKQRSGTIPSLPPQRRPAVTATIDPSLLEIAAVRAEVLGVPLGRLLDVALREELARHGLDLPASAGLSSTVEDLIRAARSR